MDMAVYLHSIRCLGNIVEHFSAESKRRIHSLSVACSSVVLKLAVGLVTGACSDRQHGRHLAGEAGAGGVTGGRQRDVVGRLERRTGDDQRRTRFPLPVTEIRHSGVLEQSGEDHHEARHQVDVDALQVRNLQVHSQTMHCPT